MSQFVIKILLIVTILISSSTLADAAGFSTVSLSTYANAFIYGPINVQVSTASECQGYNALENNLTVSPAQMLRLFVNSSIPNVPLKFALSNPAFGQVNLVTPGIVEITYLQSGTTFLAVSIGNKQVTAIPIEFIPQTNLQVNFVHVFDADGNSSWRMNQENMLTYIQQAQSILNQIGVNIVIGSQQNQYIASHLGNAIDAASDTLSIEESAVLSSTQLDTNAITVFTVWDYKLSGESKAGMHYNVPGQGAVIFLSDQTQKPGETLAHELSHALGLEHSAVGESYLMNTNEKRDVSQCLFSQSEAVSILAQA